MPRPIYHIISYHIITSYTVVRISIIDSKNIIDLGSEFGCPKVGVGPLLGVGDKSALIYHGQFGS